MTFKEKYKNICSGDTVLCINDNRTINITKNKSYSVLEIYKSKNRHFFRVVTDNDLIDSYEATRFVSMTKNRENIINEILSN